MRPNNILENCLRLLKKIIPSSIFLKLQPAYHYLLALAGALYYRFPSRKLKVVGVTGTKGKSTTVELISAILEEAGHKTALASTVRFKIGDKSTRNIFKMTMPGRFAQQKFLRDAVTGGCEFAVLEMTSEGTKQFRHKFIDLDAVVFLNISPEHIESHGSYESYLAAKISIAKELENSRKASCKLIVNFDDKEAEKFLAVNAPQKIKFSLIEAKPLSLSSTGSAITFNKQHIQTMLVGEFNVYNIVAAATCAKSFGVSPEVVARAITKFKGVPGRMERVSISDHSQNFEVIVDYAHTADSLEKVYKCFPDNKKICILGNTGGGRDKWKRPLMGGIAAYYCDKVILTNEDPYDEDPSEILKQMADGIKKNNFEIILDRREAINKALCMAKADEVVIITGKGTDPFIMEANGKKTPWDDATVVKEELQKLSTASV